MKVGSIFISTLTKIINTKILRTSPGKLTWHPTQKPLLGVAESSDGKRRKVPEGYLPVYVGPQLRRFVIPVSFLAMPDMKLLMDNVAQEFGCDYPSGPLQLPCDEDLFEQILMTCYARKRTKSFNKLCMIKLG